MLVLTHYCKSGKDAFHRVPRIFEEKWDMMESLNARYRTIACHGN